MSFEPREYLRHILAEANYLLEHSRDVSKAEFLRSETLRRAFVKSLEIPSDVVARLGLATRGQQAAEYADGRKKVSVTGPVVVELEGRDRFRKATSSRCSPPMGRRWPVEADRC